MQPANAVHLADRKRQQATEGTGDTGGAEEHGLAELDLLPLVPVRQVVGDAREQPGLGDAQENARREEALKVLDNSHEGHHNAPRHHDGGQPDGRADLFEHEVARNLEGCVCEEECGQAPVVLVVRQL